MKTENKSITIPMVEVSDWPNHFVDWCVNCEVLRTILEEDVHVNV